MLFNDRRNRLLAARKSELEDKACCEAQQVVNVLHDYTLTFGAVNSQQAISRLHTRIAVASSCGSATACLKRQSHKGWRESEIGEAGELVLERAHARGSRERQGESTCWASYDTGETDITNLQ